MEGECLVMRKKNKAEPVEFIEFGLHKNSGIYMRNASYLLGKAAAIAEYQGDTDTLINIAAAWLEIDREHKKKSSKITKKKMPVGFTAPESFDTMSEMEEDDE